MFVSAICGHKLSVGTGATGEVPSDQVIIKNLMPEFTNVSEADLSSNTHLWKSLFERAIVPLDKLQVPEQTSKIYQGCVRIMYYNLAILQKKFEGLDKSTQDRCLAINASLESHRSSGPTVVYEKTVFSNVRQVRQLPTVLSPISVYRQERSVQEIQEETQNNNNDKEKSCRSCVNEILSNAIQNKNFFLVSCIFEMFDKEMFGISPFSRQMIIDMSVPPKCGDFTSLIIAFAKKKDIEEAKVTCDAINTIYLQWHKILDKYDIKIGGSIYTSRKIISDLLDHLLRWQPIEQPNSEIIQFLKSLGILSEEDIRFVVRFVLSYHLQSITRDMTKAKFVVEQQLIIDIDKLLSDEFESAIDSEEVNFAKQILELNGNGCLRYCNLEAKFKRAAAGKMNLQLTKYLKELKGDIDESCIREAINTLNIRREVPPELMEYLKSLLPPSNCIIS